MAIERPRAGGHVFDWKAFIERRKDQPPRPLLVRAVGFVQAVDHAVDLGSGAMNDVRFLLAKGFKHVAAIDEILMANEVAATLPPHRFDYIKSSFEDFDFPREGYDLVNAQNSLSFIAPDQFDRVFGSILLSLKKGGVFAGQLVGNQDDWAPRRPDMTFCTAEQTEQRFAELDVVEFDEGAEDLVLADGSIKHRHFIRFIVQRPVGGSPAVDA